MHLTEKLLNIALLGAEWVMWVLIALSIVSVALLIERGIFYASLKTSWNRVLGNILALIRSRQYEEALKKAKAAPGMEARVVEAGLAEASHGMDAMADAMMGVKIENKLKLERGLSLLGTLGSNAPFIGLFGTVLGIIKAFHDLKGSNGSDNLGLVMGGISEALIATAVGLLVAIPAVMGFNFYNRRVRALTAQMEIAEQNILTAFHRQSNAVPATTQTTAPVDVSLGEKPALITPPSLLEEPIDDRRAKPRKTRAKTSETPGTKAPRRTPKASSSSEPTNASSHATANPSSGEV